MEISRLNDLVILSRDLFLYVLRCMTLLPDEERQLVPATALVRHSW